MKALRAGDHPLVVGPRSLGRGTLCRRPRDAFALAPCRPGCERRPRARSRPGSRWPRASGHRRPRATRARARSARRPRGLTLASPDPAAARWRWGATPGPTTGSRRRAIRPDGPGCPCGTDRRAELEQRKQSYQQQQRDSGHCLIVDAAAPSKCAERAGQGPQGARKVIGARQAVVKVVSVKDE